METFHKSLSVRLSVRPAILYSQEEMREKMSTAPINSKNKHKDLLIFTPTNEKPTRAWKGYGGEIENSAEGVGGGGRRYDFSLVYIFYNSFQEPQQPQFDCICQSIDAWVPLALHHQLLVGLVGWLNGWMVGYFKTIFVNPTRELLQTSSGNGRNCLIKIIIILMNALNHNNSNVKFPKNKSKKMKQNLILWQRFWNHRVFAMHVFVMERGREEHKKIRRTKYKTNC